MIKCTVHGICFGSHLAAYLACQGFVDALSTVHGGRMNLVSSENRLTIPNSLHFGDQDPAIPLTVIDEIRNHWSQAEVIIHAGAAHGFAHPGSLAFTK